MSCMLTSINFPNVSKSYLTLPQGPHLPSQKNALKRLNIIDRQVTEFMLAAEKRVKKIKHQRQYWSTDQRRIARTYSYWRKK